MGISRKSRYNSESGNISLWFENHNPFDVSDGNLTSGIRAEMQNGANCDQAEDVGTKIHWEIDHANVFDVSSF